jgi:hypothetical protein
MRAVHEMIFAMHLRGLADCARMSGSRAGTPLRELTLSARIDPMNRAMTPVESPTHFPKQ